MHNGDSSIIHFNKVTGIYAIFAVIIKTFLVPLNLYAKLSLFISWFCSHSC